MFYIIVIIKCDLAEHQLHPPPNLFLNLHTSENGRIFPVSLLPFCLL